MLRVFGEIPAPPFWFFLLVALGTLALAIRFAFQPQERTLAVFRPLSAATIASALGTVVMGFVNSLMGLRWQLETAGVEAVRPAVIVGGFAEMCVPLVLAAALLTVSWLLVAVGLHRQA